MPAKGARTRRAVLEAAIARFGREGYRATSVADIARDASVGGTAVYAYFPSKEALFLAAVDEDAAAVISGGLAGAIGEGSIADWPEAVMSAVAESLASHPLARRLLAGKEPDVAERVLEIPALAELRKACAERLRAEQRSGAVRADVDPAVVANGLVAIVVSLMMSVVQFGERSAALYGEDVVAVLEAALLCPLPRSRARRHGARKRGGGRNDGASPAPTG